MAVSFLIRFADTYVAHAMTTRWRRWLGYVYNGVIVVSEVVLVFCYVGLQVAYEVNFCVKYRHISYTKLW